MPFVDALLAGGDQERLGVGLVAVVVDLDHRTRQRHAGLLGRFADLRVVEQVLQLADAGLLLALLLAGGVVSAVLAQVAFLAAVVDFRRDDRTIRDQLVELGLESVM